MLALLPDKNLIYQLLTIASAAFVLRLVTRWIYQFFFHPLRKVPGPLWAKLSSQYLSGAVFCGTRAHRLQLLHQAYGPVVRVGPNEVSIADPSLYKEIHNSVPTSKGSFYSAATFLGHENIFSMRNEAQHSARRKMQRQPYSQQAVLENETLIQSTAETLVERMTQQSSEGVDVFPLCGLFSLEVICKVAFNKTWEKGSSSSLNLLRAMDDSAMVLPITAIFPVIKRTGIGRYLPGVIGHAFRQFGRWVILTRSLLQDFQQDEASRDKSQKFMATPLLVAVDTFLGRELTMDEALEEAMGIAFAGSGTTSTTLVYLLYNLALPENTTYQKRLREELLWSGGTLNDLQQLPFLQAVIKEVMRLNPTIISTLPRILDAKLDVPQLGISLPAGTQVGMQNYVHQRDPSLFAEPDQFRPERWLGQCAAAEQALTPFSMGTRNCIGQNLARAELNIAAAKIFSKLSLSLASSMTTDDMEMEDRFNIAPRGKKLWLNIDYA